MGGYNSTTNITNLNWQNGNIQINIDPTKTTNQAGNTNITNLNLASGGNFSITVYDYVGDNYVTTSNTPITLFSAANVTGNLASIKINNTMSLNEINSVTWGRNNLNITLQPAATLNLSGADQVVGDLNLESSARLAVEREGTATEANSDFSIFSSIGFQESANNYSTAVQKLKTLKRISLENICSLLNEQPVIIPVHSKPIKFWFNPYYSRINNTANSWFHESVYGGIFGGDYYIKNIKTAIGITCGYGSSLMVMQNNRKNNTHGKQTNLGFYLAHSFMNHGLYNLNVNNTWSAYRQQRIGNPTPFETYLAKAHYKTNSISITNELSYVFKLIDDISIRPNLGISLNSFRRKKFSEDAPLVYAQSYKKVQKSQSEIYGGLGFRKKWITESKYKNKITFIYELGRRNGSKISTDKVYTQSTPNGYELLRKTPGKIINYLTFDASSTNPEGDFKFTSTINTTLQKHQKNYRFGLKTDYRF